MSTRWIVPAVMVALGLMLSAARANLLVNGSFEAPVIPAGSFLTISAGGEGAAVGAGKLNQPLSPTPGSAVGAVPASAARMKRLQISTGTPPPTARLVGLLSSLPSQMPVTRREV